MDVRVSFPQRCYPVVVSEGEPMRSVSRQKVQSVNIAGPNMVQLEWPSLPEAKYKITLEHLADNNELVILVDDGSGDQQPECIWSSVGLDQ